MFPFRYPNFPPDPGSRTRSRSLPLLGLVLVAGGCAGLGGCRPPADGPGLAVVARFGQDGPAAPGPFGSAAIATWATVQTLGESELGRRCREISGANPLPAMGPVGLPEKFLVRCSLAGLGHPFDGLEIALVDVGGDPGSPVGAVRVGLAAGATPPGGLPALNTLLEPEPRADGTSRYRIAVQDRGAAEEDAWLVFGAETRVSARPALRELRTTRSGLDHTAAERAVGHRWTIALGAEWRDGVPALPGHPVRWRLRVPAAASLRFGYARGTLPGPRFEVRAGGAQGELLFSHSGTPAETERAPGTAPGAGGSRWSEAAIDLTRLAGHDLDLWFGVEDPAARWDSWGAWGSPLLVAPPQVAGPAPGPTLRSTADSTAGATVGATGGVPPDILLISLDTLRADHLSLQGYGRPTSPALDAWAKRSAIVFERAFAQAPWTLPSHVSMLTGLEALRHGVELDIHAARYRALANLASALAGAGYQTDAVTGGGFVHPRFGFSAGFDRYRYWPAEGDADGELAAGVDVALDLFAAAGAPGTRPPRFLFLHTYEVHPPNRARQPWFDRFSDLPGDLEVAGTPGTPTIANGFVGQPSLGVHRERTAPLDPLPEALRELPADLYDSAIAYVDGELQRLFDGLAAAGVLDRALVVITSDHGESLGEWGRFNHGHLDTANLHVPLLVALPDRRGAGRRIASQVRSIDIAPTILAVAGAPPLAAIDGLSLLDFVDRPALAKDRAAWAYGSSNNRGLALRSAGDLVFHFQDSAYPPVAGETSAFDLAADPGELADVAPRESSKVAAFRAALLRLWDPVLPGLRVEVVNASDRLWRGTLRSPLVEATTVKSFDVANGVWSWAGRGKGAFEIAPGRRYALLLQDRGHIDERMVVEIEVAGCAAALRFEAQSTTVAQAVEVDSANCRLAPARSGNASSGFTFRRQGLQAGTGGAGSTAEDAASREQLRALGYL
jgi:arylsulfatase A-like enzyme